ncbi:hypothetical protein BGY98DRAFT_916781 [Russula aff. rugulosa BPL654]|nr:hypothetical protein BGY98DRAFT_916781 [Russula aff. rugulosa BPL654]
MPAPTETHSRSQSKESTEPQNKSSVNSGVYDDSVIPPSHNARTVVLCFDGTGDQFDGDNSNIVQFNSMLKKDDKNQQVVYYQSGIGTYTIPEIVGPLRSKLHMLVDMAIANHLDAHVMGGYEFLMENYQAGDKICIFGFSRGAYTARALAGMIQKVCGPAARGNRQQVPFAYKMYTRDDETGWKQSTAFKKAFSIDVEIEFVGVWDTVSSVGIVPRTLPFTASSTSMRYFRHAISLDERRAKFKANYYHLQHPDDQKGTRPGEMPLSTQWHWRICHPTQRYPGRKDKVLSDEEYDDGPAATDVLEVWFAGCHSDIGGGSVPNGTRNSLPRIPLRWMIRQCFLANTGIQFYRKTLKHIGLDPTSLFPFVTTRPPALETSASCVAEARASTYCSNPPQVTLNDQAQASPIAACTFKSEEHEELLDALSPLYDQLDLSKAWWILEILPLRHLVQDRKEFSVNFGRGRRIPNPVRERNEKILVHRSVKTRMDADCLETGKYNPKAKFKHHDVEWVD